MPCPGLESELREKSRAKLTRRENRLKEKAFSRHSLSCCFIDPRTLRFPRTESQQTTIKLRGVMPICLSLASVWPRSVDNDSFSLALTHKLILKDKQSAACQLPARITCHMKSQRLQVRCPVRGRPIYDICLPNNVLFPTYEEEEEEEDEWEVEE